MAIPTALKTCVFVYLTILSQNGDSQTVLGRGANLYVGIGNLPFTWLADYFRVVGAIGKITLEIFIMIIK